MKLSNLFFSSLALIMSAFLFTSCGSHEHHSELGFSEPEKNPLLVVIGGNDSCVTWGKAGLKEPFGGDMFLSMTRMIKRINEEQNLEVKFIIGCHKNRKLVVTSSWDEEIVYDLNDDAAIDYFIEKKNLAEVSYSMVAGHSYGGWLAMQYMLKAEFEGTRNSLYTIDPISKVNCWFSRPMGCRGAPADITDSQRNIISESAVDWINFYQERTSYLRSSPIGQAKQNLKINESHTLIDSDPTVWNSIYESFTSTIAKMKIDQQQAQYSIL